MNNQESIKGLKQALERGADPNVELNGSSLLRIAIGHLDAEAVKVMLDHGADPNLDDSVNTTILSDAINLDLDDIVALLLEHKADPNKIDEFGHTALGCVTYCVSNEKLAGVLLQHGAQPNTYDDAREIFPFIQAASRYSIEGMNTFLNYGADPLITDARGNTALLMAALYQNVKLIPYLLLLGLNVNHANKQGITALHYAAYNGNKEMIALLLQAGADAKVKNNDGETPLAELLNNEDLSSSVKEECAQLLRVKE